SHFVAAKGAEKMSATSIALKLFKARGIMGLYRGIGATMLRDVTFSAVYFPLFAHLNKLGPRRTDGSGEAVFWTSFLAGCGAGSAAALLVNPFDGNYKFSVIYPFAVSENFLCTIVFISSLLCSCKNTTSSSNQ